MTDRPAPGSRPGVGPLLLAGIAAALGAWAWVALGPLGQPADRLPPFSGWTEHPHLLPAGLTLVALAWTRPVQRGVPSRRVVLWAAAALPALVLLLTRRGVWVDVDRGLLAAAWCGLAVVAVWIARKES